MLLAGTSLAAQAHKPSDSYLSLALEGRDLRGRWDIALRDLDDVVGLDVNDDRQLSWGEVRTRLAEVDSYVLDRLSIRGDDLPCDVAVVDHRIDSHTDGAYLVFDVAGACPAVLGTTEIHYSLLFDVDPTHRGLVKFETDGATHSAVLAPELASARFGGATTARATFVAYLIDGVRHIWAGFDHLLFLCTLLLPAVVLRRGGRWEPSPRLQPVMLDVARTVTAFTVAHTLTLGLAVFEAVRLPSRLVESAIALSVVVAALNNVSCVVERRRWLVAFGFGLIHGFGFAGVLAGLDLQGLDRAVALAGFNLGVELGQLAIVIGVVPALYLMRETVFYRRTVLTAGSCAIALLAAFWLVERSLDLRLVPFS